MQPSLLTALDLDTPAPSGKSSCDSVVSDGSNTKTSKLPACFTFTCYCDKKNTVKDNNIPTMPIITTGKYICERVNMA